MDKTSLQKLEIKGHIDSYTGEFVFNLIDLLKGLDKESKKELVLDGGWSSFITTELANEIVSDYAGENWNSSIHEMRKTLLTSESMVKIISAWAKETLQQEEKAKQLSSYWQSAYNNLYHLAEKHTCESIPELPSRNYRIEYPKELMEEVKKYAGKFSLLFPHKDDI